MKAVRQARLELSGGSTPDQLKPLRGYPPKKKLYAGTRNFFSPGGTSLLCAT